MVFGGIGIIRPNVDQLFHIAAMYENNDLQVTVLPPATVLALALACRQVHNEALRFYYGRNTFSFKHTYDLYRYLYMIGEERRECIRSIEVFWQGERQREAAELVGECINLQKLYIGVGCGTTRHTKHPQQNLWLSRGVGQLRKMCGFPNLDLRVREVSNWGPWCQWPVFELAVREAQRYMFPVSLSKFDAGHIAEFEKGLKEEMGRAVQGSEAEEVEVEEPAQALGLANVKTKESTNRVLRTRKVDTEMSHGRRKRKIPARKAGEKGETARRARRY
jgi:hypothetical protein